jgi:hypothetical protein
MSSSLHPTSLLPSFPPPTSLIPSSVKGNIEPAEKKGRENSIPKTVKSVNKNRLATKAEIATGSAFALNNKAGKTESKETKKRFNEENDTSKSSGVKRIEILDISDDSSNSSSDSDENESEESSEYGRKRAKKGKKERYEFFFLFVRFMTVVLDTQVILRILPIQSLVQKLKI